MLWCDLEVTFVLDIDPKVFKRAAEQHNGPIPR